MSDLVEIEFNHEDGWGGVETSVIYVKPEEIRLHRYFKSTSYEWHLLHKDKKYTLGIAYGGSISKYGEQQAEKTQVAVDKIRKLLTKAADSQREGATPGGLQTPAQASQRKQHESSLPIQATQEEINKRRAEA